MTDFIKKSREAGQKDEEIRSILISSGWAADLIEEGFKAVPGAAGQPLKKMGRFKASKLLVRESWLLLKQDKEMIFFPILSVITSLVFLAAVAGVYFFAVLGGNAEAAKNYQASLPVEIVMLFVVYFATYFITIFFQTGIITIANGRLNNQDLTFADGMKNSFGHIGKIALWSVVAATVGTILRMIAERSRLLGRIIIAILGAAWSILTFFIVPVIIFENLSLKESLKKSASIIKRTWGETIIINVGVGLFFVVLILLGAVVFFLSFFSHNVTVIIGALILLAVYIIVLIIISSTLDVIFKLALYRYAESGVAPAGFSGEALNLAFKKK